MKVTNNYDGIEEIRRWMRQCLRNNRETSIAKKTHIVESDKNSYCKESCFLIYLHLRISLTITNHSISY